MSYANYRQIETAVHTLTPFAGNSSRGVWEGDGQDREYCVYSYSTLIATYNTFGRATMKARKYSQTTTRLQNIIRKAWQGSDLQEV